MLADSSKKRKDKKKKSMQWAPLTILWFRTAGVFLIPGTAGTGNGRESDQATVRSKHRITRGWRMVSHEHNMGVHDKILLEGVAQVTAKN